MLWEIHNSKGLKCIFERLQQSDKSLDMNKSQKIHLGSSDTKFSYTILYHSQMKYLIENLIEKNAFELWQ